MKATLFEIADYASISNTGNLNLMGIFRNITAPALPTKHPLLFIVLRLRLEMAEVGRNADVELTLMDQDGGRAFRHQGTLTLGSKDHVYIHQIVGLDIKKYDTYSWSAFVNGVLVGTVDMEIIPPPSSP